MVLKVSLPDALEAYVGIDLGGVDVDMTQDRLHDPNRPRLPKGVSHRRDVACAG